MYRQSSPVSGWRPPWWIMLPNNGSGLSQLEHAPVAGRHTTMTLSPFLSLSHQNWHCSLAKAGLTHVFILTHVCSSFQLLLRWGKYKSVNDIQPKAFLKEKTSVFSNFQLKKRKDAQPCQLNIEALNCGCDKLYCRLLCVFNVHRDTHYQQSERERQPEA